MCLQRNHHPSMRMSSAHGARSIARVLGMCHKCHPPWCTMDLEACGHTGYEESGHGSSSSCGGGRRRNFPSLSGDLKAFKPWAVRRTMIGLL